jgi:hypothetical protein
MTDKAKPIDEIEPIPPAIPLPPPSDVPRLSIMTGPLPGLRSIILHPFKAERS